MCDIKSRRHLLYCEALLLHVWLLCSHTLRNCLLLWQYASARELGSECVDDLNGECALGLSKGVLTMCVASVSVFFHTVHICFDWWLISVFVAKGDYFTLLCSFSSEHGRAVGRMYRPRLEEGLLMSTVSEGAVLG